MNTDVEDLGAFMKDKTKSILLKKTLPTYGIGVTTLGMGLYAYKEIMRADFPEAIGEMGIATSGAVLASGIILNAVGIYISTHTSKSIVTYYEFGQLDTAEDQNLDKWLWTLVIALIMIPSLTIAHILTLTA